jgi:flagellin
VSGTTTVTLLGEGDAASEYTKLSKLSNFVNDDGRQVLENTRELTIYGNNKQAVLSMEAEDTIQALEEKFSAAIVEALGLGAPGTVNANLVKFIGDKEKTTGGNQAVEGTFVLQGAAIGAASKLSFSADQGVLEGLGFETIQEGQGSSITAEVKDAHTGAVIGSDTVTDGILRNVLQNIDIKLDQNIGSKVIWKTASNSLSFESTGPETSTLHIVDNATRAAIGANEGQTLDISIGRLDSEILNLGGATVLSFEDAQTTITKADQAIETIAASRAVVGAQMNRLDFTITNLDVSRENMLVAESRIRDLDIAEASSRLAAEQVLLQSASAMLAQANQLPSYAAQLLG